MITDINYNLSLQVTCKLVNQPKGYLAFHAPPYGGGGGGGAFFLFTTSSLQISHSLYPSHAQKRNGQQWH